MKNLFLNVIIISIFFFLMILINFLFKKKEEINQIESGFLNMDKTSFKSFSINFFFILIIFIIFDLELIISIPLIINHNFFFNFFCMMFILFTFFLDWFLNKIIWKN